MAGGLMQLVAYGAQDVYLTGNPQITFFKVIYRRHTNFAIETIEQTFSGEPSFGKTLSAKLQKNGDLITKIYLKVVLNSVDPKNTNFAWIRRIGHAMISQVIVDIGGTVMDRQYGTWMDIWYELARQGDLETAYANMIGDIPELTNYDQTVKPEYTLFIPLQFWFNKFVGLAIPAIALQYHDVTISVTFDDIINLIVRDCNFEVLNASMKDASLLINYVYLDTEERRRFAQVGHEYLMEQVQYNGDQLLRSTFQIIPGQPINFDTQNYTLNFNHPTKELFWVMKNGNYTSGLSFIYYSNAVVWDINQAAINIITNSISIGSDPTDVSGGTWTEVKTGTFATVGTFNITNNDPSSVWINPTSLIASNDYGITDKINADITIDTTGLIHISNIVTTLTIRDISIPVNLMTDTRFGQCDPIVKMFNNYGVFIDGTINPTQYGLLQLNGHDRFDTREGMYFNYVQPEECHTNTPKDGVNVYSFALFPEEHQPSGTSNFSRIDRSNLILTLGDPTLTSNNPDLGFFNDANAMFIYALSYNIMRVYSGMAGLAYSTI